MPTTTIQDALVQEFEQLFDFYNQRLFEDSLDKPVFRFNPAKKCGFRFQKPRHELIIGSELRGLSYQDMMVDFLHSMIHIANHFDGVTDHTQNQYHNQEFATVALKIGFHVQRHPTKGWGILRLVPDSDDVQSPNEEDIDYLEQTIRKALFDLDVLTAAQKQIRGEHQGTRKQFQFKYVCKCVTPQIVRCGRSPYGKNPLKVTCDLCHMPFEVAQNEELDDVP